MTEAVATPTDDEAQRLAERMFADTLSALEILSVYAGVRLGLYARLRELGTGTPPALATAAAIDRRYAREWLEQQASAGVIEVAQAATDPYQTRFRLPDAHVPVLLDEESPLYMAPASRMIGGIAGVLPQLLDAIRSGAGVPYPAYGDDIREGIAGLNRPMFRADLTGAWLSALPDIAERLAGGGARVLDLGCGQGWSTVTLSEAFPAARVHGVDLDGESVTRARATAQRRGVADRATFTHGDAATLTGVGPFDLICVFEALHDMADPVGALRTARDLLAPAGAVLIGDERVAEEFQAPGDEVERLNYGFSLLHCLPATRAEGALVEAGTVLRPGVVRSYAEGAGFTGFRVLPIEHDLWRFYRLDP